MRIRVTFVRKRAFYQKVTTLELENHPNGISIVNDQLFNVPERYFSENTSHDQLLNISLRCCTENEDMSQICLRMCVLSEKLQLWISENHPNCVSIVNDQLLNISRRCRSGNEFLIKKVDVVHSGDSGPNRRGFSNFSQMPGIPGRKIWKMKFKRR